MDPKRDPQRLSLASYPASHSVTARYGDLHLNRQLDNVALASYYEDARLAIHLALFGDEPATTRPFTLSVARTAIDFLHGATFPGTYTLGGGVGRVGRTSFTHVSGLFRDGVCLGLSDTVMVHLVDEAPTVIPPRLRTLLDTISFPARPGSAAPRAAEGERDAAGERTIGDDRTAQLPGEAAAGHPSP
ncbi:acyl-CoA thioesterase family protein [Frankia sp. AgKG'84/4]|uniref:acyl-CoA thioesterase n=1 Tax=Frankia sp. AgKG'84/4 TaxID=573490 RepID=UPI00200C8A65|nr:acyl-CoA thioesterase [Frankia sp. AgKG'84/4]MCL9797754.1 acyl-CoA thioesterase [Frankia sp. AgKG'84/4]